MQAFISCKYIQVVVNYAPVMKMKSGLRGSIFLLLATIIWGSAFVSQSVAMAYMGPFTFQAVRSALAVLGLIPLILIGDRRNKKNFWDSWRDRDLWKAGVLCGIPLFLACNLQQIGLVDTDAGKSGFLTAMYLVIVPVIGIFRKQKPTIMIPISVAVAVVGLYFLSCAGTTQISTGDLLTIGCAFMFAIQITIVDIYATRVNVLRLNAIQAGICTILSSVAMVLTETPSPTQLVNTWFPLIHTGVLSMGVAYALQIFGQRDLEPTKASLIMSLESVFAALFGAWFLLERMDGWEILGCVLVFAAVLLSQVPIKKSRP